MQTPPLVEEAMKKAAVVWLSVPAVAPKARSRARSGTAEAPGYAVWCLWLDGALYVVSGPGEQAAPGLAEADAATVMARGDHGGRIVSRPAVVSRLTPADEGWAVVAPTVAAKRLNAPGGAEATVARWAAECVLSRLVPAGEPTSGAELPDGSQAATPRPTPAARPARRPFHLHRVRRR